MEVVLNNRLKKLKEEIRDYYNELFIQNNDSAHQIDHVDEVCELAIKLAFKMGYYNSTRQLMKIILASYTHDMYCWKDRDSHHILASGYLLCPIKRKEDKFLRMFSDEELREVAKAVEEHRASFKGERTSLLSKILASADRGVPNLKKTVIRSLKYCDYDEYAVFDHLQDKFSSNGYCNYPIEYQEAFKKELKKFKDAVDNITIRYIQNIKIELGEKNGNYS